MLEFINIKDRDCDLIHEGKFLSVLKCEGWEFVNRNTKTGQVVSILPVTNEGEIILIEQFRIPVDHLVIECPAGLLGDHDENETALECAKKELLEETGYISNKWHHIYTTPKSAGMISEIEHKFIARDCEKVAEGGGVGNENIVVHKIYLNSIDTWLAKCEERDILVSAGIYAGLYML